MERIRTIHYLRGIAALLVVAFHLRSNLNNVYAQSNLGDLLFQSGSSGIDLFFIISGFIIALSTSSNSSAFVFAIKRFFRLYPVFIISLIVVYFIFPGNKIHDFIRSAVLLHNNYNLDAPFFGYNMLVPAWTLTYEIYFYLIFMLSMLINHKYRSVICSVFILTCVIGLQYIFNGYVGFSGRDVAEINSGNIIFSFGRLMSSPMLLEFIFGMMLYEFRFILKKVPFVEMVLFMCISFFICSYFSTFRYFPGPFNFGLWALVLLFGVISYESQKSISESKILSFLGDISYSLYLTHVIVMNAFHTYLRDSPIYSMGPGFAKLFYIMSICILVSWICFNLIEKPMINVGKRLLQYRIAERNNVAIDG